MDNEAPTGEEPLKVGEAAAILKVSDQTVRNWADAGALPFVRTPGGQRRFRRRDVEALLRFPDEEAS